MPWEFHFLLRFKRFPADGQNGMEDSGAVRSGRAEKSSKKGSKRRTSSDFSPAPGTVCKGESKSKAHKLNPE